MDTAGSKDTEVDIKAVSRKIAEDFKEISETIKKSISKNIDNDIKHEESLEIDLLTLVKTGLTSQYFETLGAMIALFFVGLGFLNDLEIDYAPAVVDFYDKTDFNVLAISIAIFIVIYIVLMVNLCLTLIKYYGYKALKKLQNLEVKYGLIQTKSILLSPIKVQEFRSTQNWIQKKINLRNVRISQASSMNVAAPNRRNIVDVPGCSNEQKDKLFDFIYDNKINDEIVLRPSIRKFLINFSLFALSPTIIFIVLQNNISFLDNAYFLYFTFIYFVVSTFAAWRFYRNSVLFYSENFIRIQSGFWDIKTKTIENYKIQSVMLYQAFWHKRFNLGGIILLTAGGMSYITTCNYELLKKITNNVIYKIETSKKRWM
jgi:putative membrane protein